ncbi:MAG: prolyl oligopeptidase family serine peptidase [Candidatus Latescibacteria bacterium]|nr:prolyl oligopeptidase family serine peptidase [Candidatus Latescibacterota bacterium]
MERKTAADYDQQVLDLYDRYVHGDIGRRQFLDRAARFTVGGLTAAALLDSLSPKYALAQQVAPDDERIATEYVAYPSPQGYDKTRGALVRPLAASGEGEEKGKMPGVLVIHENRGLNPYVEDVARRVATAGFLALAPDALTPLGGYPGNDDEGRAMQRKLDRDKITEDFAAAARYLHGHPSCNGRVGVVGFCFGGGMSNTLAVRLPEIISAAVPFYGRQPALEDVPKIKAQLLIHYAEHDERINAGGPAYEAALKKAGIGYTVHMYPGANHGFHNDTTPRYDDEAAKLAWKRTIDFFNKTLKG